MVKPKISKLIKKLIKQSRNKWAYFCLGQDIDFEADDYMNLFATQIAEECLQLFDGNEKMTQTEIKERIGKHFGFI